MKKIKFIAYGTLRKGSYNFDRFKQVFGDDFNHVETISIDGFGIVDQGAYPWGNFDAECKDLVVDILECSVECFNLIDGMESGAGYELKDFPIGEQKLPIFTSYQYTKITNAWKERGQKRTEINDWIVYENKKYQN